MLQKITKLSFLLVAVVIVGTLALTSQVKAGSAADGAVCTQSVDCSSNNCVNNLCVAAGTSAGTKISGMDCTADTECESGKCINNKCANLFGMKKVDEGLGGTLGSTDLITTVTRIINVILGLLGIVSVIIVLVGGFEWMTAGGNEEKTATARKRIFAGIIGLAIILSAWAIARFVISRLSAATGSGDAASIEDL